MSTEIKKLKKKRTTVHFTWQVREKKKKKKDNRR